MTVPPSVKLIEAEFPTKSGNGVWHYYARSCSTGDTYPYGEKMEPAFEAARNSAVCHTRSRL
jgi:hypothetical protein